MVEIKNRCLNVQVITLKVRIIDINDNVPTFERSEYHLRLPETAEPGNSFELPLAQDADPTPQYGVSDTIPLLL